MRDRHAPEAWYRDRSALSFIGRRYLPWLAALSLAWELAQLPLYTIWREESSAYIAFAVAHCTAGDLLIGTAALAITLMTLRAANFQTWRWQSIAIVTTLIGVVYTFASEWMNTSVRQSWAYAPAMPVIQLQGVVVGVSPIAQWLVVPTLALYLARRLSAP